METIPSEKDPVVTWVAALLLHPVTLLVVACISGLVGYALLTNVPLTAERAQQVEQLAPISAGALVDTPPGTTVLLEGTISQRAPLVHRDFVAYVREQYYSGNQWQPTRWESLEERKPALLVDLPDGAATIAPETYSFEPNAATVHEADPNWTEGAERSRGFERGDAVLALGTVVADGSGRAVQAEWLYAGSRGASIAEMRGTAQRSLPWGAAAAALCAVTVLLGVWRVRAFVREVAAEQRAEEIAQAQRVAQLEAQRAKRGAKRKPAR